MLLKNEGKSKHQISCESEKTDTKAFNLLCEMYAKDGTVTQTTITK
jgi:hypothetical protein